VAWSSAKFACILVANGVLGHSAAGESYNNIVLPLAAVSSALCVTARRARANGDYQEIGIMCVRACSRSLYYGEWNDHGEGHFVTPQPCLAIIPIGCNYWAAHQRAHSYCCHAGKKQTLLILSKNGARTRRSVKARRAQQKEGAGVKITQSTSQWRDRDQIGWEILDQTANKYSYYWLRHFS
jgi:hypothetical protein